MVYNGIEKVTKMLKTAGLALLITSSNQFRWWGRDNRTGRIQWTKSMNRVKVFGDDNFENKDGLKGSEGGL